MAPDNIDANLIKECLAGNHQAWEALLSRYEKLIYSTALRTGLDVTEVDDVFQDVCIIWLRELKHLRDSRSLGAWLVTTTRRECWARWRRKKITHEELTEQAKTVESPEKLAEQAQDAHTIHLAFQKLGEPCHRLIQLLYFEPEHHSYAEVAQAINIPVSSLGPTRARCLEKLKTILTKYHW